MCRYSEAVKAEVRRRMSLPNRQSVARIGRVLLPGVKPQARMP